MEKRVVFDFEVFFTNGGGIQGQDFRLDIKGDEIEDRVLADYIISDMQLLMVGKVNILNKYYIDEPHKRKPVNTLQESGKIDLSHTIFDGLITYKGLPAPLICDYLSRAESRKFYDEGTSFQISKIDMVANTGTYIDCPSHRYDHGKDLSEMKLEAFADLDAIAINAENVTEIGKAYLIDKEIRNKAVLVHTGWAKHWNTAAYFDGHPYLTEEAAEYLRDCAVKLVGIDSHNIDNTQGKSRPVHSTLLGSNILIVEHLCDLHLLPESGFKFSAVPPKIKGAGTFPVRAYATIRRMDSGRERSFLEAPEIDGRKTDCPW